MVKRIKGILPISEVADTYNYDNYLSKPQTYIHMVGTNMMSLKEIKSGLTLEIKFVPFSKSQTKILHSWWTNYFFHVRAYMLNFIRDLQL